MQCLIFKTMFMHASQIALYQEPTISTHPSMAINSQEFQRPETFYHCGIPNMTIKKKVFQVEFPVGLSMLDSAHAMLIKETSGS